VLPVLYSFRRCPYAMRARMAIAYASVTVELREVVLRDKPEAMLRISEKGTVPVLQLPGGEILDESRDIMLWALRQSDTDSWLLGNGEHLGLANRLVDENDIRFKPDLDRYKYPNRYPGASAGYYRERGEQFLSKLESLLGQNAFLVTDHISIADVAIFPFVRQFAFVDEDWFFGGHYPALEIWLQHFLQSELFQLVMKKYRPWANGDEPVMFP
jgi:glutathione S-transferase